MTNPEPVATESVNIADKQQQKLKELFPEVFSEGRIDFDKLRATLGDLVDDRPDRYNFTWAGKREALRLLQQPTRSSLIPAPTNRSTSTPPNTSSLKATIWKSSKSSTSPISAVSSSST